MSQFFKDKKFFFIFFIFFTTYGHAGGIDVFLDLKFEPEFDLNHDNGVLYVAFLGNPVVDEAISKSSGDASLIFRYSALITNAWFDATAPYHSTAVGVYSRIPRRPASELNQKNLNTAILYASYHVLNTLMPSHAEHWKGMLANVGLDSEKVNITDPNTAIGIGNVAGMAVVKGRQNDGMNQLGNENINTFSLPYKDYTGYAPVNTAYQLINPSRWQPDMQRKGMGLYKIQQFVTPQYAIVEPYSYKDSTKYFSTPVPYKSQYKNFKAYKKQAEEVLNVSANLTTEQKLKAEFFDTKFNSLAYSFAYVAQKNNLSLLDTIHLDFLVNLASFDAGIAVWHEKYKHDAVRPFSAIRKLYANKQVKAWGGSMGGTKMIVGKNWQSYMSPADHPEYPSASACFCQSHAQAMRHFLKTDQLQFKVRFPKGASKVETNFPEKETVITFDTWSQFSKECGQSRVWAGVHFQSAVDESYKQCQVFGDMAYQYFEKLVNGTATLRKPSDGHSISRIAK